MSGLSDQEKMEHARRVLLQIQENDVRFQRGLRLREEMWRSIADGQPNPDPEVGSRRVWMDRASDKIVDAMHAVVKEFNALRGDDRASTLDVEDWAKEAIRKMKVIAGIAE